MATVSAGTFHVIHTELVVGILSLAAISLVPVSYTHLRAHET